MSSLFRNGLALALSFLLFGCSSNTSSDVVDIKGLKVGMSLAEAIKIIETLAPRDNSLAVQESDDFTFAGNSSCQLLQKLAPKNGPALYQFGDAVIECSGKIPFYGVRAEYFRVFLIEDKVVFIRLAKFSTKDEKEFPPAYKALAEKFKVTPEVKFTKTNENTAFNGMKLEQFNYIAEFKDKQESLISASGTKGTIKGNSGNIFESDSSIEYSAKGYEEIIKKRKSIAEQAVMQLEKKQEQDNSQRLKNDL